MQRKPNKKLPVFLASLAIFSSGCSTPQSQPATQINLPPLPQQAIPPELPSWCQSSCIEALKQRRESLLKQYTSKETQP